ncbi:MAG TPA: DUF805 domain-containing protein [Rhizomicrobium sp.]|jgi:uncharacterized membrane protein YhaH (DUF805 family)
MDQLDINKLWQNFTDTIAKHYIDFDGRVCRAQFWWYIAVYAVVGVLVSIVGSITGTSGGLRSLYGLVLLLPTLGITARRLHDTGRTASWVLLFGVPWVLSILMGLITFLSFMTFGLLGIFFVFWPVIGLVSLAAIVVLIYFCAQPGTLGSNEYGPVPPVWTPHGTPATSPPASP